MTLGEWLKGKTEKDLIKIGFKSGSSFFYAGNCFAGIDLLIDVFSRKYHDADKNAYRIAKDMLANKGNMLSEKIAREISVKTRVMMTLKTKELGDIENNAYPLKVGSEFYQICEEVRKTEYEKAVKDKEYYSDLLCKPVSLLDREILEENLSIDEDGVTNLLIDGAGKGQYWTTGECRNDSKMQKLVEDTKKKNARMWRR